MERVIFINYKRYVVGMVFDHELKEILFLKRVKEPYKDCINGVGGKIEQDESIDSAMRRELFEETDIVEEHINKLSYMFTISFPYGVELNVYYIILNDNYSKKDSIDTREGVLVWKDIIRESLFDSTKTDVAGEGNIAYFIKYVLNREGIEMNDVYCTKE